ncbi:hypothetical protein [Legionella moravica]|uniref:hypothetical protein n=1 Tax=Legionella moravica TaxID=39962 RepID=UPI000A8F878C|nr:hypothetical protein [Legionella moravica]
MIKWTFKKLITAIKKIYDVKMTIIKSIDRKRGYEFYYLELIHSKTDSAGEGE